MKCSIDGCTKPLKSRSWCSKHYAKWSKYGDPLAGIEKRDNDAGTIQRGYKIHRVNGKSTPAHVAIVERILGKRLPANAVVHHADRNPLNNDPQNLVVCPNHTYHVLLHQRMDAWDACRKADWRKCWICKKYDDPSNLVIQTKKFDYKTHYHRECNRQYVRQRYKEKHP